MRAVHGCCDFLLEAKDGTYINARTLEFPDPFPCTIVVHPRKEKIQSPAPNGASGLSWTTKYGYMGVHAKEENVIFDGMNEKGLSVGALWFPGALYQEIPKEASSRALLLDLLASWMLGNFATVDEVQFALANVYIWARVVTSLGKIPPLHIGVHDAQGRSFVLEFIDGKQKIYNNPVRVLTNAPRFDWHLDNLRNYCKLKPENAPPAMIGEFDVTLQGQGSGLLGIPGDWMPASRFVRIAYLKQFASPCNTREEALLLAQHLLNVVDIPHGIVQDSTGQTIDYTQWAVIKDLTNLEFHYRSYQDLSLKTIDLKTINFSAPMQLESVDIQGSSSATK